MAVSRFANDVRAALRSIDASPTDVAFDAQLDSGEVERALGTLKKGASLLLRVAPELGDSDDAHAPTPADPIWLRLERGSRQVRGANMRGGSPRDAVPGGHAASVDRVIVDVEAVACCAAEACSAEKHRASLWLHFEDGTRVLVTEHLREDRDASSDACRVLAGRLAEALGVPLDGLAATASQEGGAARSASGADATEAAGLHAEQLARFALRTEGGHVVMRDYDSRGPRDGAGREFFAAALLAVPAIGLWISVARAMTSGASTGLVWGLIVVAAVLTVASYAFLGIARFAAKYSAASKPLLWIYEDRFVVAPWAARDGAVTTRPDGQLGAAIPIKDWEGVSLRADGGAHSIDIDSTHGPMEVMSTPDPVVAERFRVLLERQIRSASHASPSRARASKVSGSGDVTSSHRASLQAAFR